MWAIYRARKLLQMSVCMKEAHIMGIDDLYLLIASRWLQLVWFICPTYISHAHFCKYNTNQLHLCICIIDHLQWGWIVSYITISTSVRCFVPFNVLTITYINVYISSASYAVTGCTIFMCCGNRLNSSKENRDTIISVYDTYQLSECICIIDQIHALVICSGIKLSLILQLVHLYVVLCNFMF